MPRDGETMGEIMFRGNLVMKGYLKNEKATEESFAGGWFHTGDLCVLDEAGRVAYRGRIKDMLKVGGENVAASEIERVIMTVPGVLEAAVVARKDRMLDEVPVAFVRAPEVPVAQRAALATAVEDACRSTLADFKRPREVRVVDELPRSTLEKIAKAELRKLIEAEQQKA